MALRNRKGFTLIELIVVIAIIGILAGISVPLYSYYNKSVTERMLREKAETYSAYVDNFNRDINLGLMTYEDKAKLQKFEGGNFEAVNLGVLQVFNSPSYGGTDSQVRAILTQEEWEQMAIDENNYGVYFRLSYSPEKVNIISIYVMEEKMKVEHEIK